MEKYIYMKIILLNPIFLCKYFFDRILVFMGILDINTPRKPIFLFPATGYWESEIDADLELLLPPDKYLLHIAFLPLIVDMEKFNSLENDKKLSPFIYFLIFFSI